MKILSVEPTEHTATFELDHGVQFTATNLHEDVILEIESEMGIRPHTMLEKPEVGVSEELFGTESPASQKKKEDTEAQNVI